MNNLKSLIVFLVLAVLAASWMPARMASSQVVSPAKSIPAAGPWYVAPSGNDSNTCLSPSSPCATINAAIGKASPGDTVYVAAGTYTGEGTEVVRIDKNIILSGGWDASFNTRSDRSTIDGRASRRGVFVEYGVTATIDWFVIQRGTVLDSTGGGGISISQASVTVVNNSVIRDNRGHNSILVSQGTLILNDCTINHNASSGIMNYVGNITINNSTISHNRGDYGPGIWNAGTMTINNSTVSNNRASHPNGIGGGFLNDYIGTLTLNNTSIISNTATVGGGGIYNHGTVTAQNSIIANNTATSSPDCYGTLISVGYNLLENPAGCTFIPTTGDLVGVNPDLGPLIGMPGSPKYHPLLSNSSAIDAGNPSGCTGSTGDLLTDQRGAPRVGICDIGAYEYTTPDAPAAVFAHSGSDQHTPPGSPFALPLVTSVLDSLGSPVEGITVTFSAPASGSGGMFADTASTTTAAQTTSSSLATAAAFTANQTTGSYVVTATVSGIPGPAIFRLSNTVGDVYISTSGDDGNTCFEPSRPCVTLYEAMEKADSGKTIFIAQGVYTDTTNAVLPIDKDLAVSGNWDESFVTQSGETILNGEGTRRGIEVAGGVSATIERITVQLGEIGIYNQGTLTMTLVTVRDNPGFGLVNNSNLLMVSSIVQGNTDGGIVNSGTITIYNSAVVKNTGERAAGGITNNPNGVVNINNSTISFNSIRYSPDVGGISSSHGALSLNSSTVSYNTGGGIQGGGQVVLKNSIVAENYSVGHANQDCGGNITSAGYNLIGDTTGCDFIPGVGDLQNVNAALPPFLDQSGVQPIQFNSPAIDTGNPAGCSDHQGNLLNADQRGFARVGRCDMGSYEYDPANPSVHSVSMPVVFSRLCHDSFDFNGPASGWFIGEDDDVLAEQLNSEYRVVVKPKGTTYVLGSPSCAGQNYSVEVDARWGGNTGASYGLIFGIEGNYDQFFSFEVNTDSQELALFQYGPSGWSEFISWTNFPAIHAGTETNHLKVTFNHASTPDSVGITPEVNGVALGTWFIPSTGSVTGSGLIVSSYSDLANADARFDNFRLIRLEPELSSLERTTQTKAVPGYEAFWALKDDPHMLDRQDNRR